MSDEELPFGELGDLMEALVPIAADLVQALREDGPDVIRGHLLRVPTDPVPGLEHLPGGAYSALALIGLAMASPDAGLRSMLGWTDNMIPGPHKARRDSRPEPPAERERQRLVAAGVPADAAILQASRIVIERQDTDRGRRLRVVRDEESA